VVAGDVVAPVGRKVGICQSEQGAHQEEYSEPQEEAPEHFVKSGTFPRDERRWHELERGDRCGLMPKNGRVQQRLH